MILCMLLLLLSSLAACDDPYVKTTSGRLRGLIDKSTPNVRQFRGVPYAQPPIGALRWAAPSPYSSVRATDAVAFGPSCPQTISNADTMPDLFVPGGGNQTMFLPAEDFDEDCLSLSIWAPVDGVNLPIFVWFPGIGNFDRGGVNTPYFMPQNWIQTTKAHIVVSINSRLNMFGFPNDPHFPDQNLGLLDQRLALEWVRDNAVALGGSRQKIISWGQGAGAVAADYLNHAFYTNPIVSGSILESGTALYPIKPSIQPGASFSEVAYRLGCDPREDYIACMRNVSWQSIIRVLTADPTYNFAPTPDEKTIFSNYASRYTQKAFPRIPIIAGSNQHEYNVFTRPNFPPDLPSPQLPFPADSATNYTFLCPAYAAAQLRRSVGLITYRYRYDGNFSNVSPPGYPGAWHGAELPLIFGTAGMYNGLNTRLEATISRKLQYLWLTFASDPHFGLEELGWFPDYAQDGEIALLGGATGPPLKMVDASYLDIYCAAKPDSATVTFAEGHSVL